MSKGHVRNECAPNKSRITFRVRFFYHIQLPFQTRVEIQNPSISKYLKIGPKSANFGLASPRQVGLASSGSLESFRLFSVFQHSFGVCLHAFHSSERSQLWSIRLLCVSVWESASCRVCSVSFFLAVDFKNVAKVVRWTLWRSVGCVVLRNCGCCWCV